MTEYSVFKEQIATSPILSPVSKSIAVGVPLMEFLTVLFLVVPRWRLKGLRIALTLMISFTSYIIALLSFSKVLPCSCGGVLAEMSWSQHLLFNSLFIALAALAILLEKRVKRENRNNMLSANPNLG